MSSYYCYCSGKILPIADASVHVTDLGLLRSYAAFDFLRVIRGRPFRLSDHLSRFRNSAEALSLKLPLSDHQMEETIADLLARSEVDDAGVRLVITGGNSPDSMTITSPNLIISVENLPNYPNTHWTSGVKIISTEYLRDVPRVKTTGYLNAILMAPIAREHGAHDILYCADGKVLELTRNNFFLFRGDTLVTADNDVLLGITRRVVLELADGVFPIETRDVATAELTEATEAFLCGTTKGVMPVVTIDNKPVGTGAVGANTQTLIRLLDEYRNSNSW